MLIRSKKLLKFGLTACLAMGFLVPTGPAGGNDDPAPNLDSRLREQMGQVEFDPSGRPREPFLVVLVDVTKNEAVARDTGLELILGQAKTNSTAADLLVESTAGGNVVAKYRVADPRFSKMEDRRWNEADSTVLRVFVPLSPNIDLVSIEPVPGREGVVSAGGTFDPRPLMKIACDQTASSGDISRFPECDLVISLIVL